MSSIEGVEVAGGLGRGVGKCPTRLDSGARLCRPFTPDSCYKAILKPISSFRVGGLVTEAEGGGGGVLGVVSYSSE